MANPTVVFETTEGNFKAEIYSDSMPITSANFLSLVEKGYYEGIHFHRIIPEFMIQFGCDYARQFGHGKSGQGKSPLGAIKDEHLATAKFSNEPGTLSMANAGPNSGGAQFFINTVHNGYLDWWDMRMPTAKHPVFGKITEGMDVVHKIGKMGVGDRNGTPSKAIKMLSVRVEA